MSAKPPIVIERCWSDETAASARFRVGRDRHVVRFSGVAPDPHGVAEAFVAIGRLMGMENDQRVVSVPRLSRTFRQRIDTFERVHLSLFPQHHRSPIHALPRRDRPPDPDDDRRVAAFFSGGVDSFDLLAEHGDRIDDLIFVRGFDIVVHDRERNEEVLTGVRAAAEALGKPLLVIDTDLRDFSDPVCDWTWFVYGGLIATALLLGRTHRTVLCAASVADRHLPDEAVRLRGVGFGNARTELRIEGRSATRVDKVAAVASAGAARDTLRVCWQNVPGTVNCGTCTKCLRTTLALAATGGLGTIATLPRTIDLEAVAGLPVESRSDRAFLTEIRDAAAARQAAHQLDPLVDDLIDDLIDALDRALGDGSAEEPTL
jgi:hypothetical protein